MPRNLIHLETCVWRRGYSQEKDPLRLFPELFNGNATGRSVATEDVGIAPEFEVAETTDGFSLSALIPGITAVQLEVRVTAQLVIILRKAEPTDLTTRASDSKSSLPHVAFRKAFLLPSVVDARRLHVAIAGDLLTITLPKRPSVQTPRVAQQAPRRQHSQ